MALTNSLKFFTPCFSEEWRAITTRCLKHSRSSTKLAKIPAGQSELYGTKVLQRTFIGRKQSSVAKRGEWQITSGDVWYNGVLSQLERRQAWNTSSVPLNCVNCWGSVARPVIISIPLILRNEHKFRSSLWMDFPTLSPLLLYLPSKSWSWSRIQIHSFKYSCCRGEVKNFFLWNHLIFLPPPVVFQRLLASFEAMRHLQKRYK